MIDDDIRAIKRRVIWNKASLVLLFSFYTLIFFVPVAFLLIYRQGTTGRIALLIASLVLILLILLLLTRGAWLIRRLTGAVSVRTEVFSDLESLSEDISLATGKSLPELMLIDDPQCCNLFSIRNKVRTVIYVGGGIFEVLDPDELRSAIAHEMAHINNGDAGINTVTTTFRALSEYIWDRMPVANFVLDMLGAIFFIVLLISSISLAFAYEDSLIFALLAAISLPFAYIFVFGMIAKLFFPFIFLNRDLVADKLAAKWTLQPASLIEAMLKAQAYDKSKAISFMQEVSFVPTVRVNPHKDMQSGTVEKRISSLKESFNLPR